MLDAEIVRVVSAVFAVASLPPLALAAYYAAQAIRFFFPMVGNLADPKYAYLGPVLLFSDRFFTPEGAASRRRYVFYVERFFFAFLVAATLFGIAKVLH